MEEFQSTKLRLARANRATDKRFQREKTRHFSRFELWKTPYFELEISSALSAPVLRLSVLLSLFRSGANRQVGASVTRPVNANSFSTCLNKAKLSNRLFHSWLPGAQPPFQRFGNLGLHHHAILLVSRG